MNDADKMREAFERWFVEDDNKTAMLEKDNDGDYIYMRTSKLLKSWQAATAQQAERIKDLEAQIEHQRAMLTSRSY